MGVHVCVCELLPSLLLMCHDCCCSCNQTQQLTPFAMDSMVTVEPGRGKGTTLYCFTITMVGANDIVPVREMYDMGLCALLKEF